MFGSEAIERPFGISVFGSAVLRVEPDTANITLSVSRLKQVPRDAFSEVKEGARGVSEFLRSNGFTDFGTSRITLESTTRHTGQRQEFIGYTAKTEFRIILKEVDRLEQLLIGVVDAGANEIDSVNYQASSLKSLRIEARKLAVSAARDKAQSYADAANVKLGRVIHITDVNPDTIQSRRIHGGERYQPPIDSEQGGATFSPGAISVGGAVLMAFSIE